MPRLFARDKELAPWLTKESAPANRFRNGLTYLKRTGASGQRFLRDATGATRSRMLRYYDRETIQIRLTKAKAFDPDVSRADVRGLLDDLGVLDDAQLREFNRILSKVATAGVLRMSGMNSGDLRPRTNVGFSRAVKARTDCQNSA